MTHFHIVRVAINAHHVMYDEVVEAMTASLRELGHVCTNATNEAAADAINILIGSTIFATDLDKKLTGIPYIVYQLERLDSSRGLLPDHPAYRALLAGATEIWDYAPSSAAFLRQHGFPPVRLIPPGHHACLERFAPVPDPDIDLVFAGTNHPRRLAILNELAAAGVKVVHLDGCYGSLRDDYLARAKITLNIHAWADLTALETVRISYLLANRCFVISEIADHDPYPGGVIYARYEALASTCLEWLGRPVSERVSIAESGRRSTRGRKLTDILALALLDGDFQPQRNKDGADDLALPTAQPG